jgi:hypothetical protein
LLTNDPQAQATDYGRRNWQEQSFRDLKRGGWRWNSSQVWQPTHADRLILLLALAYGWMVALGTDCLVSGVQQRLARGRRCRYSVFRLGLRLWFDSLRRQSVPSTRLVFADVSPPQPIW